MENNLTNLQRIKIYTNESVQVAVAEGLSCRDVGNYGLTDEQQLDYACKNSLIIFTHDDDFLKLSAKYMAQGKKSVSHL